MADNKAVMARTTITIEDYLLKQLKRESARRDMNLNEMVHEIVSSFFVQKPRQSSFKLKWKTVKGKNLPPVDVSDRDQLYNLMEKKS